MEKNLHIHNQISKHEMTEHYSIQIYIDVYVSVWESWEL